MTQVKGKRAEKSRLTRRTILAAARDLFVERGYGATTLQDIADRAGYAVQTVYFVFGNKRTVLKELSDSLLAGDDEQVPTVQRAWFRAAVEANSADESLRRLVAGAREMLERVAPLAEVMRTAATIEPEISELWKPDGVDPRHTVYATAADALVTKPDARPGLSAERAADELFALLSPELYLVLVRDRGWPAERWEEWVRHLLRGQLLANPGSSG
ncbi:TetR/AcrR family transcriptional regulator [Micromonospora zhanjiangensis]|uniref:TetR/AcrR family transcriptional regulator n=1 Tax=Micromonospora zhanjiangensis TaxID=1522057 RepID=A0ABV8KHD2_9ACTN